MHSTRDAVRSLAAAVEKQADASDAMLASLGGMRDSLGDMRDSIQANTRAVLHVLDEIRGSGPGPAGAPA
ncbi:MAG: hypothetical protein M3401_02680 [Actinomycetota bacterium]|nr:hypothetical protein [Actinomycetota bacterium]